jgi:hypothetical protein
MIVLHLLTDAIIISAGWGGHLGRGRDRMPINIDLVSLNLYQGDVSNIR